MTDFYETLEAGAGEVHRRVWRFCSHKFLFEWRFLFVAMAGYLCWFFIGFRRIWKLVRRLLAALVAPYISLSSTILWVSFSTTLESYVMLMLFESLFPRIILVGLVQHGLTIWWIPWFVYELKDAKQGWFRGLLRHKIRGNLTVLSHVMCRRTFKILVLHKQWDHHQGLQRFKCREILTPPILSIYSNKPGPDEWRAFGLLLSTGSFHHFCLYPSGLSLKMHRKSFPSRAAFLRSTFPEFAVPLDTTVEGNILMFQGGAARYSKFSSRRQTDMTSFMLWGLCT